MRISIIGAGYVGLVSSACFAELGYSVDLIDVDNNKIDAINLRQAPIYEVGLEALLEAHIGQNLRATANYNCIPISDITIICVGTPSASDGRSDLSMIESSSRSVGEALRNKDGYHVVAVKSTVPPGTTRDLVMGIVLKSSKKSPTEIGFIMNPEFLREGLAVQDFMNPDRIVIGSSDRRAGDFFQQIYKGLDSPILRTGLSAAEMIKYASNSFLATKISFSNEVGNICKSLGIDTYEVMKGVGMDHRISPHFLNAGAGFGGSCFPKDVTALICLAEDIGMDPIILKSVMRVNERQCLRIIELLEHKIGNIRGKRIAVLGLAFKNDTDDARESRAIPVIAELKRKGASITGYDPKANRSMAKMFPDIEYVSSAAEALTSADACLVMTEWPEFSALDKEFDLMKSRVIIEGRRILTCKDLEGICW